MAKLIKSHTNYVLRRKVQETTLGNIYERDWMTVSEMDGFAPGAVPVYQSGNFKITVNDETSPRKRYSYGNWLKNDGEDFWTLDNTSKIEIKVDTTVLKPNYSSILDFAYYGSATELIQASVTDIIKKFPGELYISSNPRYISATETLKIGGKTMYIVENPFEIDVHTEYKDENDVENPDRFMCLSYDKYQVIYSEGTSDEYRFNLCWTPYNKNISCPEDYTIMYTVDLGFTKIYGVYIDGEVELLHDGSATDFHIRLKKEYIDEAFEKFDDFERMLLNRDSKPIYKVVLDTPIETDSGAIIYKDDYVWPSVNGWNLDFSSSSYSSYINSLLKIAKYYDEYRTDSLYRAMTHETIKNFDWTTPADTNIPEIDGVLIDNVRMGNMIRVYGRQFDDMKRYVENIRTTSNLSYDEHNNVPDNILSKLLEYDGWDVKDATPSDNNSLKTVVRYPGEDLISTPEDANLEFMRRLGLNSREILSRKGTVEGIKMILSLFGIPEVGSYKHSWGEWWKNTANEYKTGYTINEYDVLVKNFPNDIKKGESGETPSDIDMIKAINEKKNNFTERYKETMNPYVGLMVSELGIADSSGNTITYLVPWVEDKEVYDGNPYFQLFGGWGKRNKKDVDFFLLPDLTSITEDVYTTTVDFGLYDETVKNINIVQDIESLQVLPLQYPEEGDVYYVLDVSQYYNLYPDTIEGDVSNYFIFAKKEEGYDASGVTYSDTMEWVPVFYGDFEMLTASPESAGYDERRVANAARVVYFESINDVALGNNPHNGNHKYDCGREYLKYFDSIFRYSDNNDNFSKYREGIKAAKVDIDYSNRFLNPGNPQPYPVDITTGASAYGFSVFTNNTPNYQIDNNKVWFFLDEDNVNWAGGIFKETDASAASAFGDRKFEALDSEEEFKFTNQHDKVYEFSPIRVDTSGTTDNISEVASYSILNTKRLVIKYRLSDYYREYVTNVVESYLKQVIPSTTILEFEWETIEGSGSTECYSEIYGMVGDDPTVFGVLSDENGGGPDDGSITITPSLQIVSNDTTSARLSVSRRKVNKDTMVAVVTQEE